MKSEKILRIEELDYSKHKVDKDNAFLPLYYQMKMEKQPDGTVDLTNTITAKNISGEDIPEGKEDFSYYYICQRVIYSLMKIEKDQL